MTRNKTWTVKEAREHFSDVLDAAQAGLPQRISRRGKATFILVSEKDWAKPKSPDDDGAAFVAHLLAFPGFDDDFFLDRGKGDRPVPDFGEEDPA
jgi:antitoxin Phd